MARLWNFKDVGRNKHWVAWNNMFLPIEDGGLGFRTLIDISKELFSMLWWILELKIIDGMISCGTNNVRSKNLRWHNGEEVLILGNTC